MKKILFAVIGFISLSCTNPSIEEGLAILKDQIDAIELQLIEADIAGMQADVDAMTEQVEQAIASAEEANQALEEALASIASIRESLAAIQTQIDQAATADQLAEIKTKVESISEGIAMLVFLADYDYDGVMNGLDQCPETPITEINNVDAVGCTITG